MKTCTWCGTEKNENEFNKKKGGANGLSAHCRECQRRRHSERYAPSKPHLKYYSEHSQELKEKRDANRVELNEYSRKYYMNNKDKRRETVMKSRMTHIESHRKYCQEYKKRRKESDPAYMVKVNLSSIILSSLRRMSENGKTRSSKEYGIDFNAIYERIGPRPGSGREYHLDHIIPLAAFNFNNPIHVSLANLPCNLRWISRKENLLKSSTIPEFAYQDPELKEILRQIGIVK